MDKLPGRAPPQRVDAASLTSATTLLRLLHVQGASIVREKVVLRDWLAHNNPCLALRISLRSNGFGLVLDETDDLKGFKRPKLCWK
jgi:hypothetical protein